MASCKLSRHWSHKVLYPTEHQASHSSQINLDALCKDCKKAFNQPSFPVKNKRRRFQQKKEKKEKEIPELKIAQETPSNNERQRTSSIPVSDKQTNRPQNQSLTGN